MYIYMKLTTFSASLDPIFSLSFYFVGTFEKMIIDHSKKEFHIIWNQFSLVNIQENQV